MRPIRPRRTLAAAACACLLGGLIAGPTPPAGARDVPAAGPARTLTLITGDRVTVAGGATSVEPGPGRAGTRFVTSRVDGHLTVLPQDAVAAVRGGRMDPRLFDVTALLDFGYDRRDRLPLIVQYGEGGTRDATAGTLAAAGATMVRDLPAVSGIAVEAGKGDLGAVWAVLTGGSRQAVRDVWLDGLRRPVLDESVPQVGAPQAWAAGYDGTGVTVAVLDSGIDAKHPDLAGKVLKEQNFTEGTEDDLDRLGHGTHVASTVAGTGAASAGRYKGVAPGAKLLDGKVCVVGGCAESWIIAGMQWAAEQGATVANLSLGGPDTPGADPVEQAVGELTAKHGTLFVVAAGNVPGEGTVGSPATADAALAVGAGDGRDRLADFSSRGPRAGDGGLKPDITAPGVDITAARGADAQVGEPGQTEVTLSGTSMATPHVAGAAAIVAQKFPSLTAAQLKSALMSAARPAAGLDVFAQGAGRLDVARAVAQTVTTDPASLSLGRQAWPHADDAPLARQVTYRNGGAAPVTLNLAVSVSAPDGGAVPAAMLKVSPAALTVPAGGQATATVTADTRLDGPDGQLTGRLTATAGGSVAASTVVGVDREVESYDLTVTHLGRSGAPEPGYTTVVVARDGSVVRSLPGSEGTVTERLARGDYTVMSAITTPNGDSGYATVVLAQPALSLTANATVTLDTRLGKPVTASVPATDAKPVFVEIGASSITQSPIGGGRTVEIGTLGGSFGSLFTAGLGADTATAGFVARVTATFARPDGSAAYHVGWLDEGRMPTGFTRAVAAADLATVRADQARETAGSTGQKLAWPVLPDTVMGGFAQPVAVPLPGTRTEYYSTEGRVRWFRSLAELSPDGQYLTTTTAPPAAYAAGQSYSEAWNRGVFGPSVAQPSYPHEWVSRTGDSLLVLAPLYGDAAGRAGYSTLATGGATLYRNGARLDRLDGLSGEFTLPPEPADYRLEITADRGAPADLSTRVAVAWTFRSQRPTSDAPVRLPLSTVRFAPPVNSQNTAPAGQSTAVPVTVVAQPGSGAGANQALTVEASFDDGATWVAVPVSGGQAAVPAAAGGYVSLRATATDTAGNTVTQTVIRAYRTA